MVAQRGALGQAGGAAGVLDVDRVVEREGGLAVGQRPGIGAPGRREQLVPARRSDVDGAGQRRTARRDLVDHRGVVGVAERGRCYEQAHARMAQGVAELVHPVGGVDVDEDRADPGGGVLQEYPLRTVRRPDADPVALVDPGGEQPARQPLDLAGELAVGPPAPARDVDQRLPVTVRLDGAGQVLADRLSEQREGRHPARVRRRGRHAPILPPTGAPRTALAR